MTNIVYSWNFEDKKNRSSLWYIIAISVVVGLVIWGFLTKQYGMSFVILLISGLMLFVENNAEDQVEVKISDLGVYIAQSFYEFDNIKKFETAYQGDQAIFIRLYLKQKGIAIVDVKVNNQIISDVQHFLSQQVEDAGKAELTGTDKIIRYLNL